MRTAYLDCIGGISGDMTLAALLDAGVDVETLLAGLRTLDLPPWELEVTRTRKSGIAAAHVEVRVRGEAAGSAPTVRVPPADDPLGGEGRGERGEDHRASAGHAHGHHEHGPSHTHEGHTHSHHPTTRTFNEVAAIIRSSGLPEAVKGRAEDVFRRLASAEAAVHGTTLEKVHFHEVGAVDSIVDVVGAVYGFHLLGVERIVCSPLPNGRGFIRCAHGLMPVPPPATAELLKGCPLRQVDVEGELVTPTGAALASTLAAEFGPLPGFTPRQVGYGAGMKDFPFPNLLRIITGDDASAPAEAATVVVIEANIDDQSPQLYDAVMAVLFDAGALDVWLTPIQMKKNRPAITLSVLCEPGDRERLASLLFAETTTLGVRYSTWSRTCLQREWVEVDTPYGSVRVKVGRQDGELRTATPEYEDCRRRAAERGVPVKAVQAAAASSAWSALSGPTGSPRRSVE